ncbi:MAG: DUF1501 domain-containing protein [Actinomycetota bacterium]|nr:DUF1501 domain-containing protein [Actinomycetota bacterium]
MNRTGCEDLVCTRRRLLAAAGFGMGALALDVAAPAMAFAQGRPTGDLLVVVTLGGGADGMTLVPPLLDPGYLAARPTTGIRANQALALNRSFGLHPGLAPLMPYWKAHRLAVVHAVGDRDGSRSHFEATDSMERGINAGTSVRSGWLDRHLEVRGLTAMRFPALAVAPRLPASLVGLAPSIATTNIRDVRIHTAVPAQEKAAQRALTRMYAGLDGPIASAAQTTLSAVGRLAPLRTAAPTTTGYPSTELATQLQQVALVSKADVGLEVACVSLGGWDTHAGMGTATTGLMHDLVLGLGQALAAFMADLGPRLATTTIVTLSEFGRRLAENGSNGLDHGHGSSMLVMGGGIRGGKVYGRWPGLAASQLESGDLRVTTDYRDVLGELIVRRLGGGPLSRVFPDHKATMVGLAAQR